METARYNPQEKESVYYLIEQAQQGDEAARETLVIENTGLVKKIASKYAVWGHELEDLMQIGYIGLIKAIDNFDPSYGCMLSTYAVPSIMGEIKRYIRDDGPIKISRSIKQDIIKLKEAQRKLEQENGACPRISQLAEATGLSTEYIMEIMSANESASPASLDEMYEERGRECFDRAEASLLGAGDESDRWDNKILLENELVLLSDIERNVMLLRYYSDYTQSQVARRLGISQVQVSRIEKRVIIKLKENLGQYSCQIDK